MCGIFGSYNIEVNDSEILTIFKLMKHRGPDQFGIFNSGKLKMFATRLSIVDVKKGSQPMTSKDSNHVIVMNGEIYNYKELRNKLSNHSFESQCDTEVVLHLYEENGPECVKYLDGMFAFAIYDGQKIFLARDRFGIKPLFYSFSKEKFAFSSERKPLLFLGINWNDIKELESGSVLIYQEGKVKTISYSKTPIQKNLYRNEEKTANMLKEFLTNSVKNMLIGEAKIGILLSGGLDSTIIAKLLTSQIDQPPAFSVGMDGSSDVEHAEYLSKDIGLKLYKRKFGLKEIKKILPSVIWHLEDYKPLVVRNSVPTYFASEIAEKRVKVVMCGEGADELFGGYDYFKTEKNLGLALCKSFADLPNINLSRVDRMSMIHSIEARVPYLDTSFVSFSFNIATNLKIRNNIEKYILRCAFRGDLPEEVICRPKVEFQRGTGVRSAMKSMVDSLEITEEEFYGAIHHYIFSNPSSWNRRTLKELRKEISNELLV